MDTILTPEVRLAIETGIKDGLKQVAKAQGDAKDSASPDTKTKGLVINLTLEVDELAVGHDTDRAPTCSIPLLPTLALLTKRMGATRKDALAMIKDAMTEALTLDKPAAAILLEEFGVAEAEEAIKTQVISELPRTPVKKTAKAKGVTMTVTGVATRPTE
jgi:hypothetical protein